MPSASSMFQRRRNVAKEGAGVSNPHLASSLSNAGDTHSHPLHGPRALMSSVAPLQLITHHGGAPAIVSVFRITALLFINSILIITVAVAAMDVMGFTTTAAGQSGTMSHTFAWLQILLLTPVALGTYWLFLPQRPTTAVLTPPMMETPRQNLHESTSSSSISQYSSAEPLSHAGSSVVGSSQAPHTPPIAPIQGTNVPSAPLNYFVKPTQTIFNKRPFTCPERGALYAKYGQPLMGPLSAVLLAVSLAYAPAYLYRIRSLSYPDQWAADATPPLSQDEVDHLFVWYEGPVVVAGDGHLHLWMCFCDLLVAIWLLTRTIGNLPLQGVRGALPSTVQPFAVSVPTLGASAVIVNGFSSSVNRRQNSHTNPPNLACSPIDSMTTFSPFSGLTIAPANQQLYISAEGYGTAAKNSALIRPDDKVCLWEVDGRSAGGK